MATGSITDTTVEPGTLAVPVSAWPFGRERQCGVPTDAGAPLTGTIPGVAGGACSEEGKGAGVGDGAEPAVGPGGPAGGGHAKGDRTRKRDGVPWRDMVVERTGAGGRAAKGAPGPASRM